MFGLTPYVGRRRVSAYNPFLELDNFEKVFWDRGRFREFSTDIRETETAYELEAELPGFAKEDIAIDIEGERLTILAEHKAESEEKDKKGDYIYRERRYGSYSRCFDITGVNADEITASYKDGVLQLTLPKKEKSVPEARRLSIQ